MFVTAACDCATPLGWFLISEVNNEMNPDKTLFQLDFLSRF